MYMSLTLLLLLSGEIKVSDLNFSAVAFDTPFNRDLVEECVRDVINEFSRALSGMSKPGFFLGRAGLVTLGL